MDLILYGFKITVRRLLGVLFADMCFVLYMCRNAKQNKMHPE